MNIYPKEELNRISPLDVKYLRRMFVVFIVLYGLFAFLDGIFYFEEWRLLSVIRFGIVIPILTMTLVLSYRKNFSQFYEWPVSLSFVIGGCGIAWMLIMKPDNVVYYGGLFMVIFSGYLLIKLSMISATISGWFILFFYLVGSFIYNENIPQIVLYGSIFFLGANIIGMVGVYNIMMVNRSNQSYLKEIKEVNKKIATKYTEKVKRISELENFITQNLNFMTTQKKGKTLVETLINLEQLIKTQLQNADDIYITALDLQYRYLYFNEAYKETMNTRYKRKIEIGKSLMDVFKNPENKEVSKRSFDLAFKGASHTKIETYQREDIRHYEVHYTPLHDEDNQIIGAVSYSVDITKRIRSEMILKETENRYKLMAEQSRTFIYDLDLNGLYTFVSPMVKEVLGFDPEEMIGKLFFYDLIPNEFKSKYTQESIDIINQNKRIQGFINPLNTKQGKVVWVSSEVIPVYDANNKIIAYRGSDMDITEFKHAEDELELFKSIAEQAQYGIAISDIEGVMVYVNDTFAELHQWKKSDLIGKSLLTVHNANQQDRVFELLNRMKIQGGFSSEEVWHTKKEGTIFPTIMSAKRITGRDLKDYYVATMIDISIQKDMQISLLESEKRYRIVSEISNTGVWEFDLNNEFLWCSPEYFGMLGYHYDEFKLEPHNIDSTWISLLHEDDRQHAVENFQAFLVEKPDRLYENYFRMRCKDGSYRWIWSRGNFVRDDYGNPRDIVVGTHIDITEQKQKQDEIEHISYHDFMTELPNRRYFQEHIELLDHQQNYPIGVLIMDFNGLKVINDAFGHSAGNIALKQVSEVLRKLLSFPDIYARIGGDEFAVILPQTTQEKMDVFIDAFDNSIRQKEVEGIKYSLAIGAAIKFQEDQNMRDVLRIAENRMYKNKVLQGSSIRNKAIMSILSTLTDKYKEEKVHSERVSRYCKLIGQAMKMKQEDIKELELAGLFHDIGKISIPDTILNKPDKLNSDEWDIMKEHTTNGYQILRAADEYSDLALYALTHHERYDGKGYPNKMVGQDIPLFSRIICVVDAYEAMTSDRPYRKAMKTKEAIDELIRNKNTQFDGVIVDVFIKKVLVKELSA